MGRVQTVLGPVDAASLGITLAHEHLIHDMRAYFVEPREADELELAHQPVQAANVEWVRAHQLSNLDNLWLDSETLAIEEAGRYWALGGGTIVELTSKDAFGQDCAALARISRESGVNIIAGAGYDLIVDCGRHLAEWSEEDICADLMRDIEVGVDGSGVRAGIIGEINLFDLGDTERRVLQGCAEAQKATGVALSVHPSGEEELLAPTIEVLRRAGADLDRTIICHVDLMGFSQDAVRMVADAGCYVAFDNFGVEGTFRHPSSGRLVELADGERIEEVVRLVRDGYLERILVSHDIATKDRLSRFGGHGYSHILMRIVPQLVAAGVSSREVEALLRGNPQRVLCGAES